MSHHYSPTRFREDDEDEDDQPVRTVRGKGGFVTGVIESSLRDRVLADLRSDSSFVCRFDSHDHEDDDDDFEDDDADDDAEQIRREAAILLSQSRRADAWKTGLSGGQKTRSQPHSQVRQDSVDRRTSAWKRPLSMNKEI